MEPIDNLSLELQKAKEKGYVYSIVPIAHADYTGKTHIIGLEVLFNDTISHSQICAVKEYIEARYNFTVDLEEYYDVKLKLVIVWYFK